MAAQTPPKRRPTQTVARAKTARSVQPSPGPRAPRGGREAGKRDKRARIGEAAWELFSTEGFAATTTKAVAERAGIAAGTLFLYAQDKDDLLCLVMHDRLAEAVDRAFATLPRGAPFADRMIHVFGTFLDVYASNPAVGLPFVRALVSAQGPNGQKVNGLTFALLHRLAQHIREAQMAGEVSLEADAFLAAQNLFCLYSGALLGWASGYVTMEYARSVGLTQSIALQIRGLHA